MKLQYLLFEACEDGEGHGSWEAMASVAAADVPMLQTEVQAVLSWAESHQPGERGPLEEDGLWDTDLHWQVDGSWHVLTLSLTGPWAWGEALVAHFTSDATG